MSTTSHKNPFTRIYEVLRYEKAEISSIYFYALLNGLVALTLPLGIQSIISFVMGGSVSTSLVLLIIFVIGSVLLNGLLQVNQMKLIEKIQQQLFVRYSFQYAQSLPHLNLKDIDHYYLPELVNRFFDTVSLQKGISKLLLDVPAASIQVLFGLLLLSFYHPIFILFGVLLVTILYLIIKFTGKRGLQTSVTESNYKYGVAGYLEELARSVMSFKFSVNHALHLRKTDQLVTGYLQSRTRHFNVLLVQYWTLIGFKVLITATMLIAGVLLLVDQQINIGQFIAAEIVILTIINSIEKLIITLDNVYDVITSTEKLSILTDKPKELSGDMQLNMGSVSIQAKDISFGYKENKEILHQLSFNIPGGQKICIMGPVGAGRSTLLKVLSGSYDPFAGQLSLNDIPVSLYDKSSIRSKTGILLNEQDIFQGSLLENITMGNKNISLEQVLAFTKDSGLSFLPGDDKELLQMQLPAGGKHLSGRVSKKVLLLRALINRPALLLLEEPWLGFEKEDAEKVKNYLLTGCPSTTVLVVSNDTSFASRCDHVIWLEQGTIKAQGHWSTVQKTINYAGNQENS